MKICLINNLYKPYNKGGAEKVVSLIAQGLINSGHQIIMIASKPRKKILANSGNGGGEAAEANVGQEDGFKSYRLKSLYYSLGAISKFLRFFWHLYDMFNAINYFKIKRILKKEKCEAVITNNLMGLGFLTPLAIKRLKIKHIHLVHDVQLIHPSGLLLYGQERSFDGYFARNYAGLMSQLMGSPDTVIFPSRWLLNLHLDKFFFIKSKRIVLPNPAPLRGGKQEEKKDNNFKFLYLGQIEKHKGLDLLLDAFKKLKKKLQFIELISAGAGEELADLMSRFKQVGGVKFLGRQTEQEADELLLSADCLVVPALSYENCPTVILGAFSAGLPVIAADLGGINELIGENAGVLFRPANEADLIDKMEWVIENKNNLSDMIKAAKEKAAAFSLKNYIREIEKYL